MSCLYADICGGCSFRRLDVETYRRQKETAFAEILSRLPAAPRSLGDSVFINDGERRRASMAFSNRNGKLNIGFNAAKSSEIVDVRHCLLLTRRLNDNLANIRRLIAEICALPFTVKGRGRKTSQTFLDGGDVWMSEVANGIDIVLEFNKELELAHRMVIFEMAQLFPDIIRISHRRHPGSFPEPIIEKAPPYIEIAGVSVYVPAGTFLQASAAAEKALIKLVLEALGNTEGKIADLFCGVGTFSYPLSRNLRNKITSVDSSDELLEAFRQSANRNVIPNIEIVNRNLFKYPLDASELKGFKAVVFDPPRAGAEAQAAALAALPTDARPEKIIAVSCNPHSFVRDAAILQNGGYVLEKVTMVDQFIYSPHMELVALFCHLPEVC